MGLSQFAKFLPDYDRSRRSHRDKSDIKEIRKRLRNVEGRDNRQPAHTVALRECRLPAGPKRFIEKERHAFFDAADRKLCRHIHAPQRAFHERNPCGMCVRPPHNICKLHKPSDHGCHRCAYNAQFRRAKLSEDQNIVADKIHSHGNKRRDHWRYCLPVGPDRRVIHHRK